MLVSRVRVASSSVRTWAHLRPAVLNAFDAATTATACPAVPSRVRYGTCSAPGQDQRRVDLVADDPGPVRQGEVADALELRTGVHVTARVVRVGQQQRARALGEQPVEVVEVERVGVAVRRDRQVPLLRAR